RNPIASAWFDTTRPSHSSALVTSSPKATTVSVKLGINSPPAARANSSHPTANTTNVTRRATARWVPARRRDGRERAKRASAANGLLRCLHRLEGGDIARGQSRFDHTGLLEELNRVCQILLGERGGVE